MATYSKEKFSPNFNFVGAVGGRALGAGSYQNYSAAYPWLYHAAPSGTTSLDEAWIWVWKCNYSYQYQIGWGNAASAFNSNLEQIYFPTSSTNWLVSSGTIMQDSDQVGGYSSNLYYNWIHGYVNRITY